MAFEQLISQWPQQEESYVPDQEEDFSQHLFQAQLPTQTIKNFITDSITSQHPLISIQTESAITTQNSLIDVDMATNSSETIKKAFSTTTETLSSVYTTIRDAVTTAQNNLVTELQEKSTISNQMNVTSNSFSTEDMSSMVTTEATMNVTSTFSDILTVSQNSSTDFVTDSNLNLSKILTTTTETVSDSSSVFTDEISTTVSTVTKNILDNVNGTSTDGMYYASDDTCWIYYVILGVIIGLLILFVIGITFYYKKKTQSKPCPEYEVSQIQQICID